MSSALTSATARIDIKAISELSKVSDILIDRSSASPAVILFFGPVGAGKTTLIQTLMLALGSREVSSPTYTLHQTYKWQGSRRAEHLDLYRIESEDDLETTGVWDVLNDTSDLVLIEWAEKLPKNFIAPGRRVIRVDIEITSESQRVITIHG